MCGLCRHRETERAGPDDEKVRTDLHGKPSAACTFAAAQEFPLVLNRSKAAWVNGALSTNSD